MAEKQQIGTIEHFFPKISVAVVALKEPLKVGDNICIEGQGQSFTQKVDSMQIEHEKLEEAKAGQMVGMKVAHPVKKGDLVFKVTENE